MAAAATTSRLAILAVLLAASSVLAAAQKGKAPAKPAPGPASSGGAAADSTPGPAVDVVKALGGSSGQYSEFLDLLHRTRVDDQINAQLTDSYNGLTILAPTNAAFDKLKSGTLNNLSPQEQIQLVLYCVLPRFYSLPMLGSLNGKVTSQGSGKEGPYKYKIERTDNKVNVSTGVNWMYLGSPLSKDFPLAVYPVDKVPLPYELFGPKPPTPAPAPAPAPAKSKTKKHKKTPIADPPEADDATADDTDKKSAAAPGAGVARWVAALGVLGGAVLGGLL
ncbi:hypothetical protein ACP70R_039345 [Stipagrostis hirtigluma subsp. patula]